MRLVHWALPDLPFCSFLGQHECSYYTRILLLGASVTIQFLNYLTLFIEKRDWKLREHVKRLNLFGWFQLTAKGCLFFQIWGPTPFFRSFFRFSDFTFVVFWILYPWTLLPFLRSFNRFSYFLVFIPYSRFSDLILVIFNCFSPPHILFSLVSFQYSSFGFNSIAYSIRFYHFSSFQ